MAASVAATPSPSSQKGVPSLSSDPSPVFDSAFSGPFRIPQPPQHGSPFAVSQRPERQSSAQHSIFATPAPPRQRPSDAQFQLKPSSLPRPVRSAKSSFNLSSLSESMETDSAIPHSESDQESSHGSHWPHRRLSNRSTPSIPPSTPFANYSAPRLSYESPTNTVFTTPGPPSHNPFQLQFCHERTASTYSEPDILAPDVVGSAFFTPQTKLVKPNPAAFHSTGLLSKKNRPRPTELAKPMPETPLKKGLPHFVPNGRRTDIFHVAAAPATAPPATMAVEPGTPTGRLPPTPTRFPISSVKSKHYRSPLQESPIKNSKKLHLNGNDASPTCIKSFGSFVTPALAKPALHLNTTPGDVGTPQSFFRGGSQYKDPSQSPSSGQSRYPGASPSATQIALHRLNYGKHRAANNGHSENSPPSPSALIPPLASAFSLSHTASTGASYSDMGDYPEADMMDCDIQVHTPTTVDPPPRAQFGAPRQLAFAAYNHLVTPYPLFLDSQYFLQLQARNGRPPSPDQSQYAGAHPDYLDTNFRIVDRIGRGSFADAYKVQKKSDGRFYAVKKTIHAFSGYKDGLSKLGEVEILWQVGNHPHCVCLVAAWVQYGYLYLQMELCEGGSLYSYLEDHCRDSSLDEYRIWHILAEIAQGLKHVHDLNLVHLDLKPGNIFITENGTLKIGDFGLAARAPVSRHDDREGDRTYIAPEILRDPTFGKPADVFSLGLIILEITANVILPENGPYWHKLRQGDLTEINFGQDISPALVDLVRSMLDPNPVMRPTPDAILVHPYVAQIVAARPIDGLGALSIPGPGTHPAAGLPAAASG